MQSPAPPSSWRDQQEASPHQVWDGCPENGWAGAVGHRQGCPQTDSGIVEGVSDGLTEMERQMEIGQVKHGEGLLRKRLWTRTVDKLS